MKIVNTIKVVEINNEQLPASQKMDIYVKTHWDEASQLVMIEVEGKAYSVKLQELLMAVVNVKRSNV